MQVTLNFPPEILRQLADELMEAIRLKQAQMASSAASNQPLLTTQMVAARLKLCTKTVTNYIRSGKLHAANFGSAKKPDYRISEKDCQDFYAVNRR